MPVDPARAVIESLGHVAKSEHKKGNTSGAIGIMLIAFGIFTLPFGVPLIIIGISKLVSKDHAE